MTDVQAIRARHVPIPADGRRSSGPMVCGFDRQAWPCDAHQLGVALEAAPDGWVPRHHWQRAEDERAAAEARERRLRAALPAAMESALITALHETFDPTCSGEPPFESSQRLAAEVMRMPIVKNAALATEAE